MKKDLYTPFYLRVILILFILFLSIGGQLYSYFPPIQEVQAWKYNENTVYYKVYDPSRSKWQESSTSCYVMSEITVKDGVVFWISDGRVIHYCVYDPSIGAWQEGEHSDLRRIADPRLIDGVLTWASSGGNEVFFATYDPFRQKWQADSESHLDNIGNWICKDGVVAWRAGASRVYFSIYDPIRGTWKAGSQSYGGVKRKLSVVGGTVSYVGSNGKMYTYGYDHDRGKWYEGPTKPLAYVHVSPTSGYTPLHVWFTDMSIGAADWYYNFGDQFAGHERSPYHVFRKQNERFTVTLEVAGPAGRHSIQMTIDTY